MTMIGKYSLCLAELVEALVFCFGGITEEFHSTNTDNFYTYIDPTNFKPGTCLEVIDFIMYGISEFAYRRLDLMAEELPTTTSSRSHWFIP